MTAWTIVLDLLTLGIIVFTVFQSARHGFVRTLVEVVGFIAATLLAFSFSQTLAEMTYDKLIQPRIGNTAESIVADNTKNATEKLWDSLPDFLVQAGENFGLTKESFSKKTDDIVSESTTAVLDTATEGIIKTVIVRLLRIIFCIILLLLLMVLVRLLAKLLNKLFTFHLVGKVNRFLGGAVGAIKGVVWALLFSMTVALVASCLEKGVAVFDFQVIRSTYLTRYLLSILPFTFL